MHSSRSTNDAGQPMQNLEIVLIIVINYLKIFNFNSVVWMSHGIVVEDARISNV